MFGSKKGFQMSINMIVVLILGIVILGIGISIFSSGFKEVVKLKQNVDSQSAQRINSLLDDGSIIVVPFANKDGKRGGYVDFDLGISNELGSSYKFSVLVTYAGSTAFDNTNRDPFNPIDFNYAFSGVPQFENLCPSNLHDAEHCGTYWVLKFDPDDVFVKKDFVIANNEKVPLPIRIVIPKKGVNEGQYIFNLDVCYNKTSGYTSECNVSSNGIVENRYGTRQKLYIKI